MAKVERVTEGKVEISGAGRLSLTTILKWQVSGKKVCFHQGQETISLSAEQFGELLEIGSEILKDLSI
jgi:hypothetical protein